ncbi:MAG TPA: GNAT family N-acetyltransferase [Dehalococcoidia bacterium]|nr:GNAT family N-acetyltransferase [Dehalococcoidia bacterium]
MSIEVRPVVTDAEWERHCFISAYAFNGDRSDEATRRRGQYYDRSWALAAFDGSEMVAGLTIIPFEQYVNGAPIKFGGIASVSCLPERRRGGSVGRLLAAALAQMRDQGQVLSGLYTPHYSLYRKFGWELAGRTMAYAFAPKTVRVRNPAPAGSWRRVDGAAWAELDAIYRALWAPRSGAVTRSEQRWRQNVLSDYGRGEHDAAIWSDETGAPRGYVVYSTHHREVATSPMGELVLRVRDWAALDAEAYAAVLQYLLNHDLAGRVVMLCGADEPLPEAFDEPAHITEPPGAWFGMCLRLVDVQRALEARPALAQASGRSLTVGLTDDTAPWNAGTWRIECRDGRMTAERTQALAELEMDARALAPIYNGFTKVADAARVGSVRSSSDAAIAAATDIFSTTYAPYCPDDF